MKYLEFIFTKSPMGSGISKYICSTNCGCSGGASDLETCVWFVCLHLLARKKQAKIILASFPSFIWSSLVSISNSIGKLVQVLEIPPWTPPFLHHFQASHANGWPWPFRLAITPLWCDQHLCRVIGDWSFANSGHGPATRFRAAGLESPGPSLGRRYVDLPRSNQPDFGTPKRVSWKTWFQVHFDMVKNAIGFFLQLLKFQIRQAIGIPVRI